MITDRRTVVSLVCQNTLSCSMYGSSRYAQLHSCRRISRFDVGTVYGALIGALSGGSGLPVAHAAATFGWIGASHPFFPAVGKPP